MKNILLWIIRLCSVVILLLPLYVDGSIIYPYALSKILAFQFLVEVLLGAFILLQCIDPSYRVNRKNRLIQAQSLWIGALVALSFMSVDVARSWWSTAQWMTGTVTYIHLFVWFLVLASVFKKWKEWRAMIWTSVIASLLVALYGLGQMIGFDARHYDPELGRIYSTLGNPIYLSHYLVLNIFLAAFLALREKAIFNRIILCFFACVLAGTIFFTGTRSAVLVLFITLGLFFVLLLFSTASKRQRIISLSLLGTAIASIVGIFLWLQTANGTTWARAHIAPSLQRIIYDTFQDPARVELAHIAWQGFVSKPLFGWGPNNYSYVFSTYVKPHDFGILFPKLWYDAAHNQVMNILATTGIVGFIAFLLPWCAAWWLLWRKFWSSQHSYECIGYSIIGLSLFAYFLDNLTAFDTPGPLIVLYFIFALVTHITHTGDERAEGAIGTPKKMGSVPLTLLIPLVGISVGAAIILINVVQYARAQTAKKAVDSAIYDIDRGLQLYRRALSGLSFTHDDVRQQLIRSAAAYHEGFRVPSEKKKEYLLFAISEAEKSVNAHPLSLEYGLPLLYLYRFYAGEYSDATIFPKAERLAERLVTQYPRRRDVQHEKAIFAKMQGDYKTAQKTVQTIIDLDPRRGESYWWAAQIAVDDKRFADFFAMVDNARVRDYKIFEDGLIYVVVATTVNKDNIERALKYVEESLQLTPNTLTFRAARAILLHRVGKLRQAQIDIDWVRKQDSAFAEQIGHLYSPFSF